MLFEVSYYTLLYLSPITSEEKKEKQYLTLVLIKLQFSCTECAIFACRAGKCDYVL